jgi:hypothetical protein
MKYRYKIPKTNQLMYLEQVAKISKLSVEQLARTFRVSSRTYRDWKRGKFFLPVDVVSLIEREWNIKFPLSKQHALNKWKQTKAKIAQRGGYARFKKYGSFGTSEGRRLGGIHGMEALRRLHKVPPLKVFSIPPPSQKLAEFIGIMLGDGHVGDEQWSITLNAKKDKEYAQYCSHLMGELFHFQPTMVYRSSSHVLVIYGGGKFFIKYLRSIGLTAKNKVKEQVGAPQWIIENSTYCVACLRGLMDTDGGIFKHQYMVNRKKYSYPKLSFANRSVPLLRFVYETLLMYGMTPKLIDKVENKKVWLYNQQEVKQYLSLIGTHNPRLLVNVGG